MKTIYKSIALEAALLSVTLALQAEIQSEGETVTADVQASTLDRLKVTLVSPNVSGARDLVASGNATIDGNEIAVNLENLAFGTHRLVVSARFGTQIRTLYALDISVPQAELPNETQEYEDAAIVVSTYGDGGGGGEFPTDYAKQGDDPTATLTDAQAYAQAAAEDAAAAKTAAQSLTSLDSDINAGKTAIAQAVTAKGVPTSPTDTMLQMATNVTQIAQAPISINGGEMYAKQLFGALTTPNYWNLYEVLANLLSDGRLQNYGGILLAEYYKGYDSLALSGAGAGGAYVVSDKDANGNFIMYIEDVTHVWGKDDDGKADRWVAYCFADASHDFEITNTDESPRSILIGRHVGVIRSYVNGRCSKIITTDGNKLDGVVGEYTQAWDKHIVFRNIQNCTPYLCYNNNRSESIYASGKSLTGAIVKNTSSGQLTAKTIVIDFETSNGSIFATNGSSNCYNSPVAIFIKTEGSIRDIAEYNNTTSLPNLKILSITAENLIIESNNGGKYPSTAVVYINYVSNDSTKGIRFSGIPSKFSLIEDVRVKNEWCKPIDISLFISLTEENMYAHILQRLKQDEPDCGDGVTITLGQTNLDKLTSQESIDLLDTLTNTYGYTFA